MINLKEHIKEFNDFLGDAAGIIDEALKIDEGGKALIALVGDITLMVISGGTDIPNALLAIQNLNKIILNLKQAKEQIGGA